MTQKALDILEEKGNPKKPFKPGFFLQVEGASIDKQDHAFNPCAQIGETVAFDKAIQLGLAYAAQAQGHPGDRDARTTRTRARSSRRRRASPGRTSTLIGKDAAPGQTTCVVPADGRASNAPGCITVNYATSTGSSQTHTGHTVRIAAEGPQAANALGLIDQTEIFHIMARALGLE